MAQAQRQLLEAVEAEPKTAGEQIAAECANLFQRQFGPLVAQRRQISLGDIAAVLFLCADPELRVAEQARTLTVNFLYQQAFNQGIRSGPRAEPLKKLLGAWMQQASGQAATQVLQLAMQYNIKEGLDLALRLVREKDYLGGMSILAVGKLGTKEHLPVLEALLGNDTVVVNVNFNNKPGTAQVRDLALGMMIHLTGQPIKGYGFEFFPGTTNDQVFFAPLYLAFSDQAKRDAAHKKWQEWVAKQPKQ
jgi:hypothetical protein